MPVVEADFLKGLIDPRDELHKHSMKALERMRMKRWHVASSALLELDLLLKNSGVSLDDRHAIFETLRAEIPEETILPITHQMISKAILLQKRYSRIPHFYFDSIHIATAATLDGEIVSSDRTFDKIEGIKRIPLEKL